MTTITATPSTSPITGAHVDFGNEGGMALSPDVVIALLRKRLGDMDDQIGTQTAALQDATRMSQRAARKTQVAQAIQAELQRRDDGGSDSVDLSEVVFEFEGQEVNAADLAIEHGIIGTSDAPGLSRLESQYEAKVAELTARQEELWRDGSPETHAELILVSASLEGFEGKLRGVRSQLGESVEFSSTAQSFGTIVQSIQTEARAINSGNEMRMVQLQSLMQQRSQVISMSTQMLNKIHESEQAITRNI